LILDTEEEMIYIKEGARCSETHGSMETAEVTKIHKYRAMGEECENYAGDTRDTK
jgi:hypothetical protein